MDTTRSGTAVRGNREISVPYTGFAGAGWTVIEEGLPGRTAVFDDPVTEGLCGLSYLTPCMMSHAPLVHWVVMLGTNDTKERFGCNAYLIAPGHWTPVEK